MLRFALNSLESVIRKSIYISIISSDMQNLNYGFCGTFLKSAFGAKNLHVVKTQYSGIDFVPDYPDTEIPVLQHSIRSRAELSGFSTVSDNF